MTLIFNAHLCRCPYPDEITQVGLLPPQLVTQDDFAAYAAFAKPTWVPVLLTFMQKYRLMDAVLAEIRRTLDGEFRQLLMTCRVPGVTRFPTAYNSEDIFKVADLTAETQRLRAFGIPFLTLHEGFVRHPMEQGENEFRLALHRPGVSGERAFRACVEALLRLGLEEC
jgi:hypothetical protein